MEWPSKWNSWRKKVSISVKINKANLQWGFNLRQWVDAETQWGSLAFTCNRRVAMWTGSLATQLFKYICFVVPGAGEMGQRQHTQCWYKPAWQRYWLHILGVPCFMLKKLNSMFPWCSSVEMFPKYLLFLSVLGAGCQERRLHTDLTLSEHLFSQFCPAKGRNLDALAD